MICHVETWTTFGRQWGWSCFTCKDEEDGFPSIAEAEAAGEQHRIEVATQQLIDDGELP